MSEKIIIEGGYELEGEVRISGAKNATVALIPATVLASSVVTIYDVPDISDVEALSDILRSLNVEVNRQKDHLIIDPSKIKNIDLVQDNVTKLRASYYFMGALLGRFKKVKIKMPGGCFLGPRPIDLHLKGFKALGAEVKLDDDGIYEISANELLGTNIYLDFPSVGATINIMMAAIFANGRTVIENSAKEPEIVDLAIMLNKMGAKVRGAGTDEIIIDGVSSLGGCFHEIIPDRIEAGTYIVIAAACAKKMKITNIIPHHLEGLISKLEDANVAMELGDDSITIVGNKEIKAIKIKTQPYPGFATDLQSLLGAFLTQAKGVSMIEETIYPERFKYCEELNKMGANIKVKSPVCFIEGVSQLKGTEVSATDLRCGAALIIAGLLAKGTTTISNAYHIYRGYENIVEKLRNLNARIWEEK